MEMVAFFFFFQKNKIEDFFVTSQLYQSRLFFSRGAHLIRGVAMQRWNLHKKFFFKLMKIERLFIYPHIIRSEIKQNSSSGERAHIHTRGIQNGSSLIALLLFFNQTSLGENMIFTLQGVCVCVSNKAHSCKVCSTIVTFCRQNVIQINHEVCVQSIQALLNSIVKN